MEQKLLRIINSIYRRDYRYRLTELKPEIKLNDDLGFDSLDLAELSIKIEMDFGVDVFKGKMLFTVGEIMEKLNAKI
jgi:acyl carrier protein